MTRVAWGSSLFALVLLTTSLVPVGVAKGPEAIFSAPFDVKSPITGLAMDAEGHYAAVVVTVDSTPVLPGQTASKQDVYAFDLVANGKLWEQRHGETVRTGQFPATQSVSFAAGGVSGTPGSFVVGGPGNTISKWNTRVPTADWEKRADGAAGGSTAVVAASKDGTRVAAAVNGATGSRVLILDGMGKLQWDINFTDSGGSVGNAVNAMEFARDGRLLVIGTDEGVTFIDPFTARRPDSFTTYRTDGAVVSLDLSADGSYVVAGSSTGSQGFVYYFPSNARTQPWGRGVSSPVTSVAVSNDGRYFAAGTSGGDVHFFERDASNVATLRAAAVAPAPSTAKDSRFNLGGSGVANLDYDATGETLVVATRGEVVGFHPSRNYPIWRVTGSALGLDGQLQGALVGDSGERVFVAGYSKVTALKMTTTADVSAPEGTQRNAVPGDVVRFPILVKNTGSTIDTYLFKPSKVPGWVTEDIKPLTLLPDESAVVHLNVTSPTGASPGYAITKLSVESSALARQRANAGLKSFEFNVTIARLSNVRLEASEKRIALDQGQEATFAFTVKNLGNADALVNFTSVQSPSRGASWKLRFDPEQLPIAPGETKTGTLVITAPQDGADGDSNTITIRGRVGNTPTDLVVTARVNPQFDMDLTANTTAVFTKPGKASFVKITIANTGNTPDSFNMSAIIPEAARLQWKVTLDRDVIDVPARSQRAVTLTIKSATREPTESAVTVTAVSQGTNERQSVTITMEQEVASVEGDGWWTRNVPAPALAPLALSVLAAAALLGARRRALR